jgi:formate dehydrogenase major subunit
LYNRASAAPDGRPWSERKKLVWWDEASRRWVGHDRADFDPEKPPDYQPPPGAVGMAAIAGTQPFIFKPDGVAWLYAPAVKDGPLPVHYERVESPVGNLLYPKQTCNPTVRFFEGPLNLIAHTPTAEYPVVATTFRLTEHYLSGPMSRFNSWLNELQPEMFVELSPELAAERRIIHGDWVIVQSARARIEARAMVTRRLRPLLIGGRVIHQIGIPFHWAFAGEVVGGNANDLTSLVADPNVSMHECKAFACQVYAGRLDDGAPRPTKNPALWPTHDAIPDTPAAAQPEGRFGNGR